MSRLPAITAGELVRVLERLGFFKHHQVGSHAQFKNPDGKRITVSIHPGKDVGKKTLRGIIDDLEMTVEEFIAVSKGGHKS